MIDLMAFTEPDCERIATPFRFVDQHRGGIETAIYTDGRIMLQLDECPADVQPATEKKPDPTDLLKKAFGGELGDVVDLPPIELPRADLDLWWGFDDRCDECNGLGACRHCMDGKCIECEGTGKWKCTADEAYETIVVGDSQFGRRYLYLVSQLPGVKAFLSAMSSELNGCARKPERTMVFTFDGGRGILMPKEKDKSCQT